MVEGVVLAERWQLESQLGAGAMGSVYRGRDLVLDRDVAIKLLAASFLDDDLMVARFRREAMASSRLVHPSIVTTLDFGVSDGLPFIVMELVDGVALDQVLAHQGRVSIARAVSLARDVAAGLAAAHRRDIVHRDIKPGNVMLARNGVRECARIVDFGIAQAATSDEKLTRVGVAVGTVGYVAPEQLMGSEIDGRADLFSLGVTLFEMVTGELPWVQRDPVSLLRAILDDRPRPVHLLRPEAPAALDDLLRSLLRSRASERPSTAAEVEASLEAIADELGRVGSSFYEAPRGASVLSLAAASLHRTDRAVADQQLRWFTRCVDDEGGRVAQSIGSEVVAVLPSAEAALRLGRTHPSADIPRPSLALHQGATSVDETGMALGPGVRAVLRLARLAGPEEVLLTEQLHAAVGLGWRGRVERRGRFLLDTDARCSVFAILGEHRAVPEPGRLEADTHTLHWRCACGGHGQLPATSSTLLRVRCPQCSRLLELDLSQPASEHRPHEGHPLTSIVLTSARPPTSDAGSEDDAVIAALSGFGD
ncbi:MAG: serine/threonine-protein kinase [Nannocystaceae bacterium]|nr:serine/threonine protein kinase [bacterium]